MYLTSRNISAHDSPESSGMRRYNLQLATNAASCSSVSSGSFLENTVATSRRRSSSCLVFSASSRFVVARSSDITTHRRDCAVANFSNSRWDSWSFVMIFLFRFRRRCRTARSDCVFDAGILPEKKDGGIQTVAICVRSKDAKNKSRRRRRRRRRNASFRVCFFVSFKGISDGDAPPRDHEPSACAACAT